MGRLNMGILGGISGKVGTVVGGRWKGVEYIRSVGARRNRKPSFNQEVHRAKFTLAINFLREMSDLLAVTFPDTGKMSGFNEATGVIINKAVTGLYPDLKIDYKEVQLSKGRWRNPDALAAASPAAGVVTFTWKNNVSLGKTRDTDKAILVVYCESLNLPVFAINAGLRSEETATIAVPGFSGKPVQTWIAFISENESDTSNSVHTGELIVQ